MTFKILDAAALSRSFITKRDLGVMALLMMGLILAMGLGGVVVFEQVASLYRYLCAAGVVLLTFGYMFIAKREAGQMEEFVESVMIRATLQGLLWCIIYTIIMSLWVIITQPAEMMGMILLFVVAMPWSGGMFGYGMARLHFRKLSK